MGYGGTILIPRSPHGELCYYYNSKLCALKCAVCMCGLGTIEQAQRDITFTELKILSSDTNSNGYDAMFSEYCNSLTQRTGLKYVPYQTYTVILLEMVPQTCIRIQGSEWNNFQCHSTYLYFNCTYPNLKKVGQTTRGRAMHRTEYGGLKIRVVTVNSSQHSCHYRDRATGGATGFRFPAWTVTGLFHSPLRLDRL
jgi:hypothetical protein